MLSMRALECLVAIVEQGSLTQAAAVLHMSQPAQSHQIAAIERELATPVIERLPRGIRPTAAGLAAAAEARVKFGDQPETAVIRMRWARSVAREAFADPVPEPGADADAARWLVIRPRLHAEQTSGTPGAGRREPARYAAASGA